MKQKSKRLLSAAAAAVMLFSAVPASWAQSVEAVKLTEAETQNPLDNCYNVIVNAKTGRVISVENGGMDNLAKITVEELSASSFEKAYSGQIWRIAPISDELCYVVNKKSLRALDVPDAKKEDGVQLIQYSYNGNSQQKMRFEKENGTYTISPNHAETYLADQDGKLVQISDKAADNARWVLKTVSGPLMDSVKDSAGYKALGESQKRAFDTYFFSDLALSKSVYASCENLLLNKNYYSLGEKEQKQVLTTALTYTASGQVTGNVTNETVAPYKIVSKEQVENFDIWRGSRCTAWVFQVEMEGDVEGQVHKFQFATNEENPDAEMITKSIEAIGVFPYALRQHVHYLYWKKGDTANSYNGGGNSIWIRLTWEPSRQQISQTLSHELGHVLEQNMLNDPDVWSLAEKMDACPISSYGSSNETEDLAEFSRLYWTNLGKDTFGELEKVYPNRLKIFKGLLYRADKEYFKDYAEFEKYIDTLTELSRSAGSDSDNSLLDETKEYAIIDTATDKAITVRDNSTGNDVPLVMERYTAKKGQHFRIEKYENLIKIISTNSNKPIQLDDSALSGKTMVQYGGTWAIDEKFAVYNTDAGTCLMAPRYGLYVSPMGDNCSQAMEPNTWKFVEVGTVSGIMTGKITINGLELKSGESAAVVEAASTGDIWKITPVDENGYIQITNKTTGLSMDILNANTAEGEKLITYDYYGSDNQIFVMEDAFMGFRLKNKNSNLYLTVNEDGSVTQQKKGENQVFTMEQI